MSQQTLSLGTIFTGRVDAKFRVAVASLDRSLVALNTLMGKTTKATTAAAAASTRVGTAQTKAAAGAKKHTKALHPMNKQIAKVHGAMERFKAALKVTAAYGAAATGIFLIVDALKAGTMEIINFDQALRNLEAITRALPEEIVIMSDRMIEVAKTTKFSTTEIAEGMVLLGQAGFSAAEGINAIQAVADLASGTLTDMKSTADLVTSALRAFQLDSIEAGRTADVFANAINKSKLTMDKIRTSFNYIGAAAYQVGLSIEETAATMMLLANNGLRASTIGTGFRQVLSRMIAPSRKLKEAFKDYGIEIDSINPKTQGYTVAMENLSQVITEADGITVDMAKTFSLFGLRGAQAAAVIADGFLSNKFKDALKKVHEVGSAEKMAAIQAKGLWFQFKNLADRAGALAIALGEAGVKGILQALVITLRTTVILITKLVEDPLSQVIIKFGLWTTATLLLVKALSILTVILPVVLKFLGGIALSLYATPWAAIAIAITGVVIAYKHFDQILTKNVEKLKQQIAVMDGNIHSLKAYKGALQSTFDEMKEGDELSEKHLSTLERLKKAHPELAEMIDSTVKSYEGYNKILKEVNKQQEVQERARILKLLELLALEATWIDRAGKKVVAARKRAVVAQAKVEGGAVGQGPATQAKMLARMVTDAEKILAGAEEERAKSVAKLTTLLYARAQAHENVVESGERWITVIQKIGKFTDKEIATIRSVLIPELERLAKARAKATGKREVKESMKAQKASLKFQRRYLEAMARMEGDQTGKLLLEHKARLLSHEQSANEQIELAGKNEDKLNEIRARKRELDDQSLKFYKKKLLDRTFDFAKQEADLEKKQTMLILEEKKQRAVLEGQSTKEIDKLIRQEKIASLRDALAQEKEYFKLVTKFSDKRTIEVIDAEKRLTDAQRALSVAVTADLVRDAKEREDEQVRSLKAQLKLVTEFSDEWLTIQGELYDKGKLSAVAYHEAINQNMIRQMSWWERLRHGMDEAKTKGTAFKDTWIEIGKSISGAIADNMTTSLLDFAKGTKTAKDAFQDFAQSTIDWLFKMIVRQQIYNALIGATTSWIGTPAPVGETRPHGSVQVPHSGGVLGQDAIPKRYHVGGIVRQNEVPIIAEKGEGVFTKGQMKAMGGPQNITVKLVNKSDKELKATQSGAQFDMGQLILNVVLEGTSRNKGGFRDGMKGALS